MGVCVQILINGILFKKPDLGTQWGRMMANLKILLIIVQSIMFVIQFIIECIDMNNAFGENVWENYDCFAQIVLSSSNFKWALLVSGGRFMALSALNDVAGGNADDLGADFDDDKAMQIIFPPIIFEFFLILVPLITHALPGMIVFIWVLIGLLTVICFSAVILMCISSCLGWEYLDESGGGAIPRSNTEFEEKVKQQKGEVMYNNIIITCMYFALMWCGLLMSAMYDGMTYKDCIIWVFK